jgi:hypothetical protein
MSDYDTDILEWSERQSALLRRLAAGEKINDQIDWPNIIDEVETVGRSERAALRSHIAVVLEHLMKLQASPSPDPRKGWEITLIRARSDIERSLRDSPSLRPAVAGMITDELPSARKIVASTLAAYGEQPRVDIGGLTYAPDQLVGEWFPQTS